MTTSRIAAAVIAALTIGLIAIIVALAIGADQLWSLIGGVFVLCVFGVALAAIGVVLYGRMSASRAEREKLLYNHAEEMAKHGLMINDRRTLVYAPMPREPQISAPAQQRTKVFDFNTSDLQAGAVNYILFSRNLLGETGNRLASAPECAGAGNIENYSARSWERIVAHLSNAYGVVRQPGPIANGGGVYVPAEIGTVGNLYNKVLTNSAVDALPSVKR